MFFDVLWCVYELKVKQVRNYKNNFVVVDWNIRCRFCGLLALLLTTILAKQTLSYTPSFSYFKEGTIINGSKPQMQLMRWVIGWLRLNTLVPYKRNFFIHRHSLKSAGSDRHFPYSFDFFQTIYVPSVYVFFHSMIDLTSNTRANADFHSILWINLVF